MKRKWAFLATFTMLMAAPHLALATDEGDPVKGKKYFKKCKACHQVDKEKNVLGPHLVNIIGRKAGVIEGYKYSKALKAQAAEGLVWTPENIDAFIKKPKKFMKGTKMGYAGVKKENQRKDIIAYFESLQKPAE